MGKNQMFKAIQRAKHVAALDGSLLETEDGTVCTPADRHLAISSVTLTGRRLFSHPGVARRPNGHPSSLPCYYTATSAYYLCSIEGCHGRSTSRSAKKRKASDLT